MSEPAISKQLQVLEVDPKAPPPYEDSPFTASLATATDVPIEHKVQFGRRYHAYAEDKYVLPNDESEIRRLELQHLIWSETLHGALHLAPLPSNLKNALDIGCGTGAWACDFAAQNPHCQVTGADLSSHQRSTRTSNVKFVVHDITSAPWPFGEQFDYIHSRAINIGIKSWPDLIDIVWDNLQPGGWVEFQEFAGFFKSDDGSLSLTPALEAWCESAKGASKKLGLNPTAFSDVPSVFQAKGFENVGSDVFKQPIGPWAKGELEKRVGRMMEEDVIGVVDAMAMRLCTTALGWTEDEVRRHVDEAVRDIKSRRAHGYMQTEIAWAQKPVTANQ